MNLMHHGLPGMILIEAEPKYISFGVLYWGTEPRTLETHNDQAHRQNKA